MINRNIYIVGGQHKKDAYRKKEWHQSEKAVVVKVNMETGEVNLYLEYSSPPEVCPPDDPSVLFKAGTVKDDKFYL